MSEASDNHHAAVHRLAAVGDAAGQQGRETSDSNSTKSAASARPLTAVDDPFFNTADAGNYLGIPKATLLTWRARRPGYGPRAVKAGGRLKYRLSELDRWLQAHEESFAEDESADASIPVPDRASPVRTRNRASRVGAGALRAARS